MSKVKMEGNETLCGEHIMQYTNDVKLNCISVPLYNVFNKCYLSKFNKNEKISQESKNSGTEKKIENLALNY